MMITGTSVYYVNGGSVIFGYMKSFPCFVSS